MGGIIVGSCVAEGRLSSDNFLPGSENKYLAGARISEANFRQILRFFAADVPALTATKLCAANYRTIHRLYSLLRHRVARLALAESGAKLNWGG